ncbi:MAG: hypothetical protein U0V18_16580 [Anaerolineales bacterium]
MRYFLPKLNDIIFLSLLTSVLLMGPKTFNLDGDLGRHITIGYYILDNMSIPTKDVFSHTLYGEPLTPHEWLSQLVFAVAHKMLSLSGTVLVIAVLIGGTFSIIYWDSRQRSNTPLLTLILTILAATASSIHWLARPHIFTFLFLAIWAYFLEQIQRDRKIPIWIFGILMVLWANTHGAFIAGFVVLGAYTVGHYVDAVLSKQQVEITKMLTWIKIVGVSVIATFLNPSGIHLWQTSLGYIGNSYLVNHTVEYQAVDFHILGFCPFLLMILLSMLVLSFKHQRISSAHALLITGWTIMGLYSARNIPLYAIIFTPIIAEIISTNFRCLHWLVVEKKIMMIEDSVTGFIWPIVGIFCTFILLNTKAMQAYNTFNPSVFPVEAINWLDENPQEGPVFNYFTWGGYLLYREWPNQLVFIDGQTDFYGEILTREYEKVISLDEGWESVLEKYEISWALVEVNSPLAKTLADHGWTTQYKDGTAIILKK